MRLEIASGVRYQTKQDLAYTTLRNAILRCSIAPGERLVIEEIARELAVSPIPVREALHLLQSEGLVEMVPHVGATVARISPLSILEVFTVMEGLEIVATRSATERMTPDQLLRLTDLLIEMDAALASHQSEHWADLNSRFHRAISQITAMPMLQEMTHRVFDRWDRLRRYMFRNVLIYRMEQAQREHHGIVAAMRDHDYPHLEKLVKLHNQGALAAYTTYLTGENGKQ